MSHSIKLIIGFSALILLRFASTLFYDPLYDYFSNDFNPDTVLPTLSIWKLGFSYFIKYALNSVASIYILYVLFDLSKPSIQKLGKLFINIGLIALLVFLILLYYKFPTGYLFPFYVRKFIINPILIIILLPAFFVYYPKNILSNQ